MRKTFWILSRLSLLLVFSICACTTQVKAPVDSRSKTPAARQQPGYSQTGGSIPAADKKSDYHQVVKGDTLYSIAWRYGFDYRDVADWNAISGNYVIYPGQSIRLKARPGKSKSSQSASSESKSALPANRSKQDKASVSQTIKKRIAKSPQRSKLPTSKISWRWPTKGNLVKLNTPTSKKGIDIAGKAGQKVDAAADGAVVYSGSGLLGYGKLIIIKHSETFLSAYAHNQKLYVKEGDRVRAGQKIATMGLGNRGRPILHFEIRKEGTPVNPLKHLPKANS